MRPRRCEYVYCGKTINRHRRSDARYCSDDCRAKQHSWTRQMFRQLDHQRRCAHCDHLCFPERSDARYCSARCRQGAYRARVTHANRLA